jgi:hypothetical protein
VRASRRAQFDAQAAHALAALVAALLVDDVENVLLARLAEGEAVSPPGRPRIQRWVPSSRFSRNDDADQLPAARRPMG